MNLEKIEKSINEAFSNKDKIGKSDKKLNKLIKETINLLDTGKIRVAEKKDDEWKVVMYGNEGDVFFEHEVKWN